MKILKLFLWLAGVVVALLVIAVIAVPLLVDPNDYKPQIAQQVRDRTGRQLTLDGDIKLSVFPSLGQKSTAPAWPTVKVSAPPRWPRLSAPISKSSCYRCCKRISKWTLSPARFDAQLERDAAGRGNWEDLAQTDAEPPPVDDTGSDGGPPINDLALGGLDLRAANIHWNDRAAGRRVALTNLNLQTDAVRLGQPFSVEADADLAAPDDGVDATLRFNGELTADLATERLTASGLTLEANASGAAVPGGELALRLTADAAYDAAAAGFQVSEFALDAAGINAAGSLTGSGLDQTPNVAGTLTLAGFSPRELLQRLGQTPPVEPPTRRR